MIGLLDAAISLIGKAVDKAFPDRTEAERIKAEITKALLALDKSELAAARAVVLAEAQGESWLQRNWRPILMLTFGALIVARWLGFAAPWLSEREALALWQIVQIGLGGYVIGRSAEKIARIWPRK